MGKFGKWIAGGLGWAFFGPIGGILGFVIGSFLESEQAQKRRTPGGTTTGDFAMSMLVLVAAVMKADGKVMKSELEYVKTYFVRTFGSDSAQEAMIMLRDLLKQNIPVQDVTIQIGQRLDYSSKLQLYHMLFEVAIADGDIHDSELKILDKLGNYLGINYKDIGSIKAMFIQDNESSYKVLDVERNATDEGVRKAYRKMANKYHPDKVEYLGDDFKKVANEKFRKVNEAYEAIKKQRGMN